jgi:hypothetical protein
MTDQPPALGHNNPPAPTLVERLIADYGQDVQRGIAAVRDEASLPIKVELGDAEALDKLVAHVKRARAIATLVETARVAEKKPFDEAGKVVQNFFSPTLKSMEATRKVAESRIAEYQARLAAHNAALAKAAADRQREEAARQAEAARAFEDRSSDTAADLLLDAAVKTEAAADKLDRLASGPVADLVRSQGASGLASASVTWTFDIVDGHALRGSLGVLGGYITDPSLEAAIWAYVRACARDKVAPQAGILPGVTFRQVHRAIVR